MNLRVMLPPSLSRWTLPLCWVAACWALYGWSAGLEWANNPQYGFGWFTLPLAALALFFRWRDRPEASPSLKVLPLALALAVAVVLPVAWIIHLSGPEWRPPVWLIGFSALGAGLCVTASAGGAAWLRHFAPAWGLALLGLPRPTWFENELLGGLTGLVSSFTADALNATGILAVQEGRLLRLAGGRLVGIEEACSGLQGLTAALALGISLGEVFRLGTFRRIALPFAGAAGSFLCNLLRSYFLCRGEAGKTGFVDIWHDTAGTAVSVLSLVCVVLVADRMRKPRDEKAWSTFETQPLREKVWPWALLLAFAVATPVLGEAWFRRGETSGSVSGGMLRLNFEPALPPVAETFPLPEKAQALLRCKDSHNARWLERDAAWQVQWLEWDEGRVSSFAGVHRPEICLPAAGLERVGDLPAIQGGKPGRELSLRGHLFTQAGRTLVVYHGVWGKDGNSTDAVTETMSQRLQSAWKGKRRPAQSALYIAIAGLPPSVAEQRARVWLEKALAGETKGP